MPNKHAAIKDLRKSRKRADRNFRIKTHIKALTRQVKELVQAGKDKEAVTALSKLQQASDKASRRHVFHKNKASRQVAKAYALINKKQKAA